MEIFTVAELLNDRIGDLAVALLGAPNRELSSQQQLRFGTKGSVAVEIAGKDAGRWFDHEASTGGAGLELIRHHFGLDEKPAWDWARHWLGEAAMPSSLAAKPTPAPASGAARPIDLSDAERATKVAEIVRQTESPNGTPAHAYLHGRGIAIQPPDCIRFRQNAYGSYGAMVALATDADGGRACPDAAIRAASMSSLSTNEGKPGSNENPPLPLLQACSSRASRAARVMSGSIETLNPFVICGLRPASAQMRPTLDGEMPMASAIRARLQWVALRGVSCTVLVITFSLVSMGSGGTREGLVLSRLRPATPSSRYRSCQRQTVGFEVRARRMISKVP